MKHTLEERINISNQILSVLTTDWQTYAQIKGKLKDKVSTGLISSVIWNNINNIQDKIEWENEIFGEKEHQMRMKFKLK